MQCDVAPANRSGAWSTLAVVGHVLTWVGSNAIFFGVLCAVDEAHMHLRNVAQAHPETASERPHKTTQQHTCSTLQNELGRFLFDSFASQIRNQRRINKGDQKAGTAVDPTVFLGVEERLAELQQQQDGGGVDGGGTTMRYTPYSDNPDSGAAVSALRV